MILIYSLIFATGLSLIFTKQIKKYYWAFYSLTILLATSTLGFEILRLFSDKKLYGIIADIEKASIKGIISIAFFILVMFAGGLSTKWNITKKLFSIRAELAIIASIMMLPHGIIYLIRFIMNAKKSGITGLSISYLSFILIGTIGFIIMIPLFVTSFKKIRRKMSAMKWKKVQKWAYAFYFLGYAHIFIILVNKKNIDWMKLSTYTILFGTYTIMKLVKVIESKKIKARYKKENLQFN